VGIGRVLLKMYWFFNGLNNSLMKQTNRKLFKFEYDKSLMIIWGIGNHQTAL
jgi:hypothetical protein